ncbi:hypothetical protein GWG54_19320 [Natronococcus sp. JC468]|uniref:hypothetical protein n=1 Tax=Natronococcus sp. JC468 TaxID=1961921 RepID=UPI00143AF3EE|nr:hypothetical protein [Natronococcus sp. JC468]NKE37905.1 hypothetical protein [Natronococcus sp. JC468]
MTRDQPISLYVTESEKKQLQAEADAADETLSSYLYKLIQKQRQAEELDKAATELNAEERIEAMIAEATDTLEETAEDIRDIHARAGTYPLVNFRLLQRQFRVPEPWIDEEFSRASRKLRVPFNQHDPLEGIPAPSDSDDRNETDHQRDDDTTGNLENRLRGDDQ